MSVSLKSKIILAFISAFEGEVESLTTSAKAAHEAATHEESKAEDSHDTRGVEASYLAGAQAVRIAELKSVILEFKALLDRSGVSTKPETRVAVGALVTIQPVDVDSQRAKGSPIAALFAVHGGGTTVEVEGKTYSIFTPNSPIGEAILGGVVGEVVEIESKGGSRAYRVEAVG